MKKLKYKNKFIVNTRTTWPKSLKWFGKLPVLSMKYKQDNDFDVIFDLENKLIRANKRAGKWREKYINNFNLYTEKIIYWRKQNDILTEERDIARKLFVITSRKLEQNREWLKVSNLKQKKAWIAFENADLKRVGWKVLFKVTLILGLLSWLVK